MEKDTINNLFENLQGSFDTKEPQGGHQERFLEKLEASKSVVFIDTKKSFWRQSFSIAAAITILLAIGVTFFNASPTSIEDQVAQISPEVSNTELYFASLIEEQVKVLKQENTPETKKIIDDTMIQLKKLETNYKILEQDLVSGGNSKLILSAMITNFQTRIDLLQNVLTQVSDIKNIKKHNDEMSQMSL